MTLRRGRPLRTAKPGEFGKGKARALAARDDERAVREAVFKRDRHRCQLRDMDSVAGRCFGQLTFHHRRKAGAQGAFVEANGLTLCSEHNWWIENEPDIARSIVVNGRSLVVREGDPEWDSLGKRAARGK